MEERGKMTAREAGKRGGAATAAKYGPAAYREWGRRGGLATEARHPEQTRARCDKARAARAKRDAA